MWLLRTIAFGQRAQVVHMQPDFYTQCHSATRELSILTLNSPLDTVSLAALPATIALGRGEIKIAGAAAFFALTRPSFDALLEPTRRVLMRK